MPFDACNRDWHIKHLNSTLAAKPKMVVPMCAVGGLWYSFLINSQPSGFLAHRPELIACDVMLREHLHRNCLSHDSYLSVHSGNLERIARADVDGAAVVGVVHGDARLSVAHAIRNSPELRQKTKLVLCEALLEMGC